MASIEHDLLGPGMERLETHISWVFLGERLVWKVKKPVNFGFLDFSTIEQRRTACEAELRLNARLAPGVYQKLVPVTRDRSGQHALDGQGEIVDWAVQMVRLPDERRADHLLRHGLLTANDVEHVASRLARFHAEMTPGEAEAAFGSPEVLLQNVSENFAQTRDTIRQHLNETEAVEIEKQQLEFIAHHRDLLEERMRNGRVRDGHGDLRLEHVYFISEEPVVIDCIEFNERFRYADVCADIAFLSMDLTRMDRTDLAERFLAAYARASGDYDLYRLVDFYEGYRAYVRAKVASILSADANIPFETRTHAAKDARRYYLLALSTGRRPVLSPVVVAVGGVIASGKSTVADRIAALMSAAVVDADRTRKMLLGVAPTAPMRDQAWTGAYAPAFTDRVYEELFRRARVVLESGRPIVLDASFRSRELRRRARALAEEYGVRFYFVETRADPAICRERLRRRAEGPSVSDGRLEIFEDFLARWEPVDELSPSEHLVADTSGPVDETVERLQNELTLWPTR